MKMSENDPYYFTVSAKVLGGRAFLIKTPPAVSYFAELTRWLSSGALGAIAYGRPRLGKTSATRWILSATSTIFGNIPWIEVPARKQHATGERGFFQYLLSCANNQYARTGTAADRRGRFSEAMIERARRSPIGAVIVFFDEAQNLEEAHYHWLMNASNEVEAEGYRMFCLFVGQHQLLDQRQRLLEDGKEEIVGRFMSEEWAFQGILSRDELHACLTEFDGVIYPKNSKTAFLSIYVPLAYASGWRIASLADAFWEEFQAVTEKCNGGCNIVIPMHYLFSSITNLLQDIRDSDQDIAQFHIARSKISLAVERSGFKNALYALMRKA